MACKKKVEVARALTLAPDILLLDEPMAGMNQEEKEDIVRFVMDIQKERHITVVLVEHDLGVVMDISDRIYVLDFGGEQARLIHIVTGTVKDELSGQTLVGGSNYLQPYITGTQLVAEAATTLLITDQF